MPQSAANRALRLPIDIAKCHTKVEGEFNSIKNSKLGSDNCNYVSGRIAQHKSACLLRACNAACWSNRW